MHEIKDVIYVGVRKLRKREKFRLVGIGTLTSATPVQRSKQLRYQANWELVIKFTREIHTNPDIFKNKVAKQEKMNIWIPWKYMKYILINEIDNYTKFINLLLKKLWMLHST